MIDKEKQLEFKKLIDQILWEEWDPIRVNNCANVRDEYESYAEDVCSKLWDGEGKQEILDYLYWAKNDYIGLSCIREQENSKNTPMVEKIILLFSSYKTCECFTLPDLAMTDMGSEQEKHIWQTFQEVKSYGEECWWLSLYQCKKCIQYWLVAQEPRQNDIHCLKQLEKAEAEKIIQYNEWPKYFETLEELFIIGKDNNRSVRFVDSLDPSLIYSIQELKKVRADISDAEIASLLNIDETLLAKLYNKISKSDKAWWKFW